MCGTGRSMSTSQASDFGHGVRVVLMALMLAWAGPAFAQDPGRDSIRVVNRTTLPADTLDGERVALGDPDDYKPDIVLLPNGELLLVAFHQHKKEGGKVLEQNLLFRSAD